MCSVLVLDFIIAIFSSLDMTVPSNVAALKHLFRFYFYDSTHRYVVDRIHEQGNNSITGIKSKNTILPFLKKIGYKMMEKEREKEIIGSPEKENKNGVLNNFFHRYVQNENSKSLANLYFSWNFFSTFAKARNMYLIVWNGESILKSLRLDTSSYTIEIMLLRTTPFVFTIWWYGMNSIQLIWFDLICIFLSNASTLKHFHGRSNKLRNFAIK